jgi:NADPH2:quinone reductase
LGADHVVNYATEDMKASVEKFTNGKFVDVIYEVVGGDVFDKVTEIHVFFC